MPTNYRHYVYKTTNLLNGKFYVGIHSIPDEFGSDGYVGSGTHLLRAIKKYGKEHFKCELVEECDTREIAEEFEAFIVDKDFISRPDTYNLIGGGHKNRLGVPPHTREITLINPNGETFKVNNLSKFCKEHSLSQSCILDLEKGISFHHKGWRIPETLGLTKSKTKNRKADKKFYHFVHEDGREFKGYYYLNHLCKLMNASQKLVSRVHRGLSKQTKGWQKG